MAGAQQMLTEQTRETVKVNNGASCTPPFHLQSTYRRFDISVEPYRTILQINLSGKAILWIMNGFFKVMHMVVDFCPFPGRCHMEIMQTGYVLYRLCKISRKLVHKELKYPWLAIAVVSVLSFYVQIKMIAKTDWMKNTTGSEARMSIPPPFPNKKRWRDWSRSNKQAKAADHLWCCFLLFLSENNAEEDWTVMRR